MKIALARCSWNLHAGLQSGKHPVSVFAPKLNSNLVRNDVPIHSAPRATQRRKPLCPSDSILLGAKKSFVTRASSNPSMDLDGDHLPVVSAEWLKLNLDRVKVLDASWYLPTENRNPRKEFEDERIPGALFFDIDEVADHDTDLPHMLPSESVFSESASKLGLNSDDLIVVYDKKGIFSAARVWWMFRIFGHEKVKILEGGFPAWKSLNQEIENNENPFDISKLKRGDFKAKFNENLVQSFDQIFENIKNERFQVVDARPKGRFDGTVDEPRKGVKRGHIPKSFNVPFSQVLTADGFLKDENELRNVFENSGLSLEKQIVASCGTGVTACILTLALFKLGKHDVAVYDGSWTEWGTRENVPIELS